MGICAPKSRINLLILIHLFMAIVNSQGWAVEAKPDRPNIIMVTISSLRADHVSALGYARETTPHFDAFAKDNIIFTQAFSASSWQMPAVGSLFTSLRPSEHGATHIDKKLEASVQTLTGVLQDAGYYTAGFGCNPRLSADNGYGRGFDFYDDFSVSLVLSGMLFGQEESVDINKHETNCLVNDNVMRWLQNNTRRPFFLSVHYYDTHWDYLPPKPYDKLYDLDYAGDIDGHNISKEPLYSNRPSDSDIEHIIALYDGEVKHTDDSLGELLDHLQSQGRFEDSLIIIMGDHGEQFYEHGHTSHHGVYDELLHVPLAISVPGTKKPGRISSLVSGLDIMPTALDYANIPIPRQCQGKSILSLITGASDPVNDYVFAEYTGGAVKDCFAVRFAAYKFVSEEGNIFAYNIKTDPGEHKKIPEMEFTQEMKHLFDSVKHLLVQNKALMENNDIPGNAT